MFNNLNNNFNDELIKDYLSENYDNYFEKLDENVLVQMNIELTNNFKNKISKKEKLISKLQSN